MFPYHSLLFFLPAITEINDRSISNFHYPLQMEYKLSSRIILQYVLLILKILITTKFLISFHAFLDADSIPLQQ